MNTGKAIAHIYALAWFATRESMPYAIYEDQQRTADAIARDICDAIGCDLGELRDTHAAFLENRSSAPQPA